MHYGRFISYNAVGGSFVGRRRAASELLFGESHPESGSIPLARDWHCDHRVGDSGGVGAAAGASPCLKGRLIRVRLRSLFISTLKSATTNSTRCSRRRGQVIHSATFKLRYVTVWAISAPTRGERLIGFVKLAWDGGSSRLFVGLQRFTLMRSGAVSVSRS